ncbi:MAG: putative ABC transporter permease YtrC [Firmicutes bacterium]|nr:putative ABC transporter permease YtrC [Bacillota bacterium]
MPLSKFWPNRTLLWKDWRLTLPVFLIWTSFVTFISTFTFVYHLVSYRAVGGAWTGQYWHGFREFYRLLESSAGLTGIAMVLLVIGLGVVSLGLERERGTLSLLVSMPYARREIFLSKTMVGLCQIGLPFIANAVLMTLFLWANHGVNFPFDVNTIWSWAVHSVLVLTFVLCVALLAATVSGKTIGAAFLALALLLFPFGMYMLVAMNAVQWEATSHGQGLYWYWNDLANDVAIYLTVPTWLIDFPTVVAVNSTAVIEGNIVERVFANRVWEFLREHTYVLYLALAGLSFGAYALAQRWFARSQLEYDGELLALPSLRPLIAIGFTVCGAILGGAVLPALLRSDGWSRQLAVILLSYASSAAMAWMLVARFLHPSEDTRKKRTTTPLATLLTILLLIGVVVPVVYVATLGMPLVGGPEQPPEVQIVPFDEQIVTLLALAEAVMERRTAALVVDDAAPLVALSNELARESPELFGLEQALIARLAARREALRQQGETYTRSEIQLVFISVRVRQNSATIVALERGKLYFAAVLPGQPEYMGWEAERSFVFVKQDAVWELKEHGVMMGKGLPPNEPGGNL